MKITDARVIVTCPAGQTYTLVKITTDAGVYGVGEGTKNGRELAVAALLEHHLAPTLIGRDPGAIEDIWKFLHKGAYWRGGPIQNSAIAAIDMALWDIKGKVAGLPVYSLLGGPTRKGLLTSRACSNICAAGSAPRSSCSTMRTVACRRSRPGGWRKTWSRTT